MLNPIAPDIPRPRKTKAVKTVRIISPHSATSDGENGMPEGFFTPSRTPTTPVSADVLSLESFHDGSAEDPFSAGFDGTTGSTEDEGIHPSTLSSSKLLQEPSNTPYSTSANPFRRTFASLSTENERGPPSPFIDQRSQEAESAKSKPLYDVDEFKKLLLAGEKTSTSSTSIGPPPVTFQSQQNIGDNNSATDASSISRQSILEATAGLLQESPGTPQEVSPIDDERQHLVGSQLRITPKSKPVTPRHRHGKLVKANAPQTVSFEDPSLSFSTSAIDPVPTSPEALGDKPLTLLPINSGSNAEHRTEAGVQNVSISMREASSRSMSEAQDSHKRNPPAPPLSRRHSQLRPKTMTSSGRSTPISEEDVVPVAQSSPNTGSKAPPPPPPRRTTGPARMNSSSSVSTNASIPPVQSQSSTDDVSSNSSKARPPMAPSYSPSVSSVKRQSIQVASGTSAIAPPPPPRRRGSSQSSYTPSRLSGEYRTAATERLRSDSGASSISHLQMTPMTATPSSTESKDVMADLTTLQKEVDELRSKFKD